jgi:hypothetical protein
MKRRFICQLDLDKMLIFLEKVCLFTTQTVTNETSLDLFMSWAKMTNEVFEHDANT